MITADLHKTLDGADGPLQLQVQIGIAKGRFAALFGPSGAGKTTILRMFAGLTHPDRGNIVVNGETWFDSVKRINMPPQKRSIGFVFQDYALFPNMSVRKNLEYSAGRGDARWIDELLELTGLTALQERSPVTLSGGQKQRVALVRALARKPTLLLLDEPLSALDTSLRAQLQDDLKRLHQYLGFTALLVSHDIGEIFKLSQQVLRLEQGRIVQSGTPSDVFLQRRVAGKFNLHAQVLSVRREEVVYVVSLAMGQDIVEVIASEDEVTGLAPGDYVAISAKAFSPHLFKTSR